MQGSPSPDCITFTFMQDTVKYGPITIFELDEVNLRWSGLAGHTDRSGVGLAQERPIAFIPGMLFL